MTTGSATPRDLACGTCPHPKSHHYFGDGLGADMRMHTWCQVHPCPCTNYTLPRKAVLEHGEHHSDCAYWGITRAFPLHSRCDCGFALAVAAAQLPLGIEE